MLKIALKEWAVVCDLMLEGRLALLLRKGGIHESGGPGVFELEHPKFALFPSWMHQKPAMLKESVRSRVQTFASEPAEITLSGVGQVVRIWAVRNRAPLDPGGALDDLHCWTREQIDMRVNYRPENPLYLMAVRVYRLNSPRAMANLPEYAGCKSWVPLRDVDGVEDSGARAVMCEPEFGSVLERVEGSGISRG